MGLFVTGTNIGLAALHLSCAFPVVVFLRREASGGNQRVPASVGNRGTYFLWLAAVRQRKHRHTGLASCDVDQFGLHHIPALRVVLHELRNQDTMLGEHWDNRIPHRAEIGIAVLEMRVLLVDRRGLHFGLRCE